MTPDMSIHIDALGNCIIKRVLRRRAVLQCLHVPVRLYFRLWGFPVFFQSKNLITFLTFSFVRLHIARCEQFVR